MLSSLITEPYYSIQISPSNLQYRYYILINWIMIVDYSFPGCNPAATRNKIVFIRTFKSGTSTLYLMIQQ